MIVAVAFKMFIRRFVGMVVTVTFKMLTVVAVTFKMLMVVAVAFKMLTRRIGIVGETAGK